MVDVRTEVEAMEDALRAKGDTVADVLRDTGIAASTWQRWRRGDQTPLMSTWEKVQAAYERRVMQRR